ncbi:MAG: tRNA epoxyqueuosine(34) reductase QueG [Anaerolineae bacterium]|nr:tRNA epoxyqueuosine(34) reductase QueG [Anaerolineae bacterium]
MNQAFAARLIEKARELGFDIAGVVPAGLAPHAGEFSDWLANGHAGELAYMSRTAEKRRDARLVFPGVRSILVLGWSYHLRELPEEVRRDPARGRIASYAWGYDYHEILRPLLAELTDFVRRESGGVAAARAYVDTGPVLERDWAAAAGLGFIGTNTCFIRPRLGSWLFLAELLLDVDLEPFVVEAETPDFSSRHREAAGTCGRCTRCLEICPTRAFVSPYVLDARRCISYLTIELKGPIPIELRPLLGNWVFGCDLCQDVCPWNQRFAKPRHPLALDAAIASGAPRLLDLIRLTPEMFRQRFRSSPILRAKRRGFLRNVCVALGNWGSSEAVPALADALRDPEPLVRGHAAWALGHTEERQRARRYLEHALSRETDDRTRTEIVAALQETGGP